MKELTATEWMDRINKALKYRDSISSKQGWKRILDEYQGDYRVGGWSSASPSNVPSQSVPPINMVYGYVHTMIPSLYFRNPHLSVNAKGIRYIQRAHILEAVVNYIFKELNIKKEVVYAIIDSLLIGHGWLKVGYNGDIVKMREEKPEDSIIDASPVNGDGPLVTKDDLSKVKRSLDKDINEYIKNDDIFCVYVPWQDVIFDVFMSKNPPHDCRWIAHRITKPIDEVKDSELYKNTSSLKSNVTSKKEERSFEERERIGEDLDFDLVELWEVWDKENNKIYAVANGHDKFLRNDDNPYEMKGLPFSMLKFNIIPGKPYPLSDITLIEPQILERIKLRAMQLNHYKRFNRQLSIEKGAMDEEEIAKFQLGIDGSIVQREKGMQPPVPIDYSPMQGEVFALDTLLQQDMDAVIGQTAIQRGGPAHTKTRTLGELSAQLMGASMRSALRQDTVEDFIEEVAMKIIELLKQFQDTERYANVSGKTEDEIKASMGDVQFTGNGIMFTRANIQGEYDVEAKAGSAVPLTKETRLNMIQGIMALGPNIGVAPGSIVSKAIGKEVLRELEIKEIEKAFEEQEIADAQARAMGLPTQSQQQGPGPKPHKPKLPKMPGGNKSMRSMALAMAPSANKLGNPGAVTTGAEY